MGSSPPGCLRCRRQMEVGYLLDRGMNDKSRVGEWIAGEPDNRWWGLRLPEKTKRYPTVAFRCPDCEMVELRAEKSSRG